PSYPPTRTARGSANLWSTVASTSPIVVGTTTSTTVRGDETSPATVTSVEPGVRASPAAANHAGPKRAMRPRCAIVSTLLTTVGCPQTPDAATGSGGCGGAGPPPGGRGRMGSACRGP